MSSVADAVDKLMAEGLGHEVLKAWRAATDAPWAKYGDALPPGEYRVSASEFPYAQFTVDGRDLFDPRGMSPLERLDAEVEEVCAKGRGHAGPRRGAIAEAGRTISGAWRDAGFVDRGALARHMKAAMQR